jgi:hypothetical protein
LDPLAADADPLPAGFSSHIHSFDLLVLASGQGAAAPTICFAEPETAGGTERATYNKQSKKLTLLQNDPSYTELLARDKLDLMKPGETIFRIEPGPEGSH